MAQSAASGDNPAASPPAGRGGKQFFSKRSSSLSHQLPEPNCYPNDGHPKFFSFTNKAGLVIRTYAWEVAKPSAAVVLVHGMQMHCRFEFLTHDYAHFPITSHLVTAGGPFASKERLTEEGGSGALAASKQSGEGRDATGGRHPRPMSPGAGSPKNKKSKSHEHNPHLCIYKGSWVEHFNRQGISVYGLDQQSFGLSQGWQKRRSNVQRFDDFAEDVITFVEFVASWLTENTGVGHQTNEDSTQQTATPSSISPLPKFLSLFLLGISMGGCVCLRTVELMRDRLPSLLQQLDSPSPSPGTQVLLRGCVLLAPMLSIEKIKAKPISQLALPLSKVISAKFPHLGVSAVEKNMKFPWIDAIKELDPYVTFPSKVPARLAVESMRAIDNAHADAAKIPRHLRFLVFHSKVDTMCEFEGSHKLVNKGLSRLEDKELVQLEGMWHYLVMEPGNHAIISKISQWMTAKEKTETRFSGDVHQPVSRFQAEEDRDTDGMTRKNSDKSKSNVVYDISSDSPTKRDIAMDGVMTTGSSEVKANKADPSSLENLAQAETQNTDVESVIRTAPLTSQHLDSAAPHHDAS